MIIRLFLIILVLAAVYYLYKYLFTSSGLEIQSMNDQFVPANPTTGSAFGPMPYGKQVYSGGEMTVNMWVYLQDLQRINFGKPNHIFSLGKVISGAQDPLAGEQTLVVYLEPNTSNLKVAVALDDGTDAGKITGSTIKDTDGKMVAASITPRATVNNVELQKWVMFTFCLNNKILDIYMDGKLARSVVLPGMYRVGGQATDALYLTAGAYGGFGGYIGNIKMANYALNPEEVWRLYMSGPSAPFSIGNWFKGLFDPEYLKKLTIPGQ